MQQRPPVDCTAFKKNTDGSWETVKNTDVRGNVGDIRLPPGAVFKKGAKLNGIEIAALLEQHCN